MRLLERGRKRRELLEPERHPLRLLLLVLRLREPGPR